MLTDDQIDLAEKGRLGEQFEAFRVSEGYLILRKFVLDVLDRGAFEAFKKVVPTEQYEIVQAQMMSKVITQIEAEIDKIISQGQFARQVLSQQMQEDQQE
jgi:hypothetical protein